MNRRPLPFAVLAFACAVAVAAPAARADEGMWTFDNFPAAKVAQKYGFTPTQAFLDHVRLSSARIAGGCSASFISPQGLVMTNHHCVVDCVGQLSTAQNDYVQNGYYAKREDDEKACPDFEIDQLVRIEDVTAKIQTAIAGKTGAASTLAYRAASAAEQASCGTDPAVRCDVVNLYHGGVYDLYHYKRFRDVRLVFAPEYAVAQFGGDPDNFNFPRFDFDIGIVRVYENGKPAATPDYLRWSKNGSKAGQLVFVSGNPGSTERQLTNAQLAYERDVTLPQALPSLAELRGILEEFRTKGPEQAREAKETEFFIENSYKAELGRQKALDDPAFFGTKVAEEKALRDAVAAKPDLQAADGSAWDQIAAVQSVRARIEPRYGALNALVRSGALGNALALVQAAEERGKPNGQRLPQYTDQALIGLRARLEAKSPFYPDLATLELAFSLQQLREHLGTDDALTKKVLGNESPRQLAERLVGGTKLGDPAVRIALFDGGSAAIAASTDPMIVFAKSLDADDRALDKTYQDEVAAPTRAAAERIAKARFAVYGTSVDPDATFTARLSFGAVEGFDNGLEQVPPYTTIGGLFERATGAPPYELPQSWLAAKASLDLATPMNFSSTNDIIGGNSGSPTIDQNGDVVGLIFDGNIFSLGGDFGYDGARNRAVSVDSRALLAGLQHVYHADRIVREIEAARS